MSHVAVILGQLALVLRSTDSSRQLAFRSKRSMAGVPRLAFSGTVQWVSISGLGSVVSIQQSAFTT